VARQILLDDTLAEDAVQESFLKVIRKRNQYIPGSPFSCWFYAIVRNVCVDMLRNRAREKDILKNAATITEPSKPPNELTEIPKVLDHLANHERDVLVLRIVHGLGFSDIAAALGISEEAAKKRAQRALKRLRTKACTSENYMDKLLATL
jgi:RNA polymerase sigma-70 factor (ECF subfamily)